MGKQLVMLPTKTEGNAYLEIVIDKVPAWGTAIADTNPLPGDSHILEMILLSKFHSLLSLTNTGLLQIVIIWT